MGYLQDVSAHIEATAHQPAPTLTAEKEIVVFGYYPDDDAVLCPDCSSWVDIPFGVDDETKPWLGVCRKGHTNHFALDDDEDAEEESDEE